MDIEFYKSLLRKRKGKILLSEGAGRKVYKVDNYVIKRAKNKRGLAECNNEYFIYKNCNKEIQNLLCPILYYEEGVVIMPYIDVLDSKYFNRYIFKFDKYNYIKDYLVNKFNCDDHDLEYHFNWGMYKNNVYLLDYGHNYLGEFLD